MKFSMILVPEKNICEIVTTFTPLSEIAKKAIDVGTGFVYGMGGSGDGTTRYLPKTPLDNLTEAENIRLGSYCISYGVAAEHKDMRNLEVADKIIRYITGWNFFYVLIKGIRKDIYLYEIQANDSKEALTSMMKLPGVEALYKRSH